MLVRHRLVQQLDHVQQCLDVNKLPVPELRGKLAARQVPTHAVLKEEKYYNYRVDLCKRLSECTYAAFAEFDAYTQQW
eukprot:8575413-Heterocapsa_arctica.AAC.1